MKRIVYVVPKLSRTGVTNVLISLASELVDSCDITVVAMRKIDETDSIEPQLRNLEINVIYLNNTYISRQALELKRVIKKLNPDIVHSMAFKSDVICFALSGEWPVVSTAHNVPMIDFSNVYGPKIGPLMVKVQTFLYRRFAKVAAVSNAVAADWKTRDVETSVVHNGITDDDYGKCDTVHNDGVLRLVWTGRISKRKNLETILRAVQGLEKIHLTVVGDGVLYQELRDKHAGFNIDFLGRQEHVAPYLSQADCFISASHSEGLPMAAIEAMSHNLLMILSDIPQHRELDINQEKGFLFFETDNVQNLKDRLTEVKNLNHGYSVRKTFLEHFTSSVMAGNYVKMYDQVIRERSV